MLIVRLWMRISNRSHVFEPWPQGVLRVVIAQDLGGEAADPADLGGVRTVLVRLQVVLHERHQVGGGLLQSLHVTAAEREDGAHAATPGRVVAFLMERDILRKKKESWDKGHPCR